MSLCKLTYLHAYVADTCKGFPLQVFKLTLSGNRSGIRHVTLFEHNNNMQRNYAKNWLYGNIWALAIEIILHNN